MKSNIQSQGCLNKILYDQKLQQEWQRSCKNKNHQTLSSEDDYEDQQQYEYKTQQKIKNITSRNQKKLHKELDRFNQVTEKLKLKTIELEEYKKQAIDVLEESFISKKKILDINAAIKDLYCFMSNKLHSYFQKPLVDLQFFKDDSVLIIKQIKKNLNSLRASEIKQPEGHDKYQKSVQQINNLNKINQRLLAHIQQRKLYTQSLKQKIVKLKQQNQMLQIQSKNCVQVQNKIQKFEQHMDIKYLSRNDLVLIIKNIVEKIIVHQKLCKNTQNKINIEDIQKLNIEGINRRSKSRQRSKEKNCK